MEISEAYAAVVKWAIDRGAESIGELPGLWHGETDEWKVSISGHREEVEGVPAYGIRLEHKTYLSFAIIQPNGGAVTGASENDIIDHFKTVT